MLAAAPLRATSQPHSLLLTACRQAHEEADRQASSSSALAHQLEEAGMELQDARDASRQLAVLLAAVAEGRCTGAHIKGSGLVDDYLTGRGGGPRGAMCWVNCT